MIRFIPPLRHRAGLHAHLPTLVLLSVLLLLSACATKQEIAEAPAIEPYPAGGIQGLEDFDRDLEEAGPENIGTLTQEEKIAILSGGEIQYPDSTYARVLITRQFLFLHRDRNSTVRAWVERAEEYLPEAKRYFRSRGLPTELVYLPFIESGYNPLAKSHAGAAGTWQFIRSTGRNYGLVCDQYMDERLDVFKATEAAADYLTFLHDMFGDWTLALAAYNAGEGRVGRLVRSTGAKNFFEIAAVNDSLSSEARLREETMHYVPRFIAMAKIINNHTALGYPSMKDRSLDSRPVVAKSDLDLESLAKGAGLSWKEFKRLNPALISDQTPPNRSCTIYVPSQKLQACNAYLGGKPVLASAVKYAQYSVRKGDTYSQIASRHSISTRELMRINKTSSSKLRIGQKLWVPRSGKTTAVATKASGSTSAPETAGGNAYRVQRGDTLYSLSKRFGVSVDALKAANNMKTAHSLRAGSDLMIPGKKKEPTTRVTTTSASKAAPAASASTYTVTSGDTVWSIARRFKLSPKDILAWNNMDRSATIRPGDSLRLHLD
ncbi:hypothetical protein DPQ33_11690 [Oceanidesulfovibrio indonesiensis]|uniref:LysM domain-containing protein n=1 Tax=Oceanidesulfovibrio indonesiensis TaxID=54767 RepID=A0A7M3MDH3_9BACT|nr:LysM peptidoglycan-binding domain-containing protein [Oceanidesulfovibrio indonesiensis]TVM16655.1 hypothetical protein DPQ33_11690 [Oceanidesulfovibrio indonesiensis]